MEHEVMEYDLVIVGAGPSGLSAAIKLKQLAAQKNKTIQVCILEKGAQVGAHILSGAVLEPKSLQALLPDTWQDAPLDSPVTEDKFLYLTRKHALHLPTPKPMQNKGNFIISLGELCQFLATEAERLGCEIYPGFAATEILYNDVGEVIGVATGSVGINKEGEKTGNFQPGMHLHAKQTLFAEGCRGQLSQSLMDRFKLCSNSYPQTYGLGIKEIWQIPPEKHHPGKVIHTVGWPMDKETYGGSFIYHLSKNRVAIGFVIGLDYQNPWLSPFDAFQQFKTHPMVSKLLSGGERISYGARALNEGGWQSLPRLTFPGGLLIGDAAGFLNVAKIKGIHLSMQSGMLAAEACIDALVSEKQKPLELKTYIARGKSPWTLANHADFTALRLAEKSKKIDYPKPDGVLTFDRLSSVYLANTFHEENQPCHLKLRDKNLAIEVNFAEYASPETRYCPAAVYEIVDQNPRLQINAQNCIHCKTCDIKDPRQNIVWEAPEGGGGPNYVSM